MTSGNGTSIKNKLPDSAYITSHDNITFSYTDDNTSFQQGLLGEADSWLMGILHLNYGKQQHIKCVTLNLKGAEKTSWHKAQGRTKFTHAGEQIIIDQFDEIYKPIGGEGSNITSKDIPFKIKLPYNLPETVITDFGSVKYALRVTVSRKAALVNPANQIAEVHCPLKKSLVLESSNCDPYRLRGESRNGLDYTFNLPPNKNFNLGTYVSVPMRIRFLRPGIGVERVEIDLNTCMDFRCSNPNETRHIKEKAASLIVPRQDIKHQQLNSPNFESEYIHTINLFIPRSVQPTYSGRFISITHQLSIRFCLWGADKDFQVEENVKVANIIENFIMGPPIQTLPQVEKFHDQYSGNTHLTKNALAMMIESQQQPFHYNESVNSPSYLPPNQYPIHHLQPASPLITSSKLPPYNHTEMQQEVTKSDLANDDQQFALESQPPPYVSHPQYVENYTHNFDN